MAGLGLDRRIDEISGGSAAGSRSRRCCSAPDALLLDEATNHLDDDAAAFLEDRLRAWRGPVLFASHDREFLDRVATGLLDLDPGRRERWRSPEGARVGAGASRDEVLAASGGTVFGGGFSEFLAVKADERARWQRQYDDEQDELRRLAPRSPTTARHVAHGRAPTDNDKFLKHFKREGVEQAVSRRVRNAEQRLATLERDAGAQAAGAARVRGHPVGLACARGGIGPAAAAVGCRGRRAARARRAAGGAAHAAARHGRERRGQVDAAGVLAGRRRPIAARCIGAGACACSSSSRTCASPIRMPRPARLYERVLGERRAEQVPLASLGLIAPRDESPAGRALSVGQQRRLALALVIARPPHVFLLDEPTNHLKKSSRRRRALRLRQVPW